MWQYAEDNGCAHTCAKTCLEFPAGSIDMDVVNGAQDALTNSLHLP
jgi:hypothetical protein